MICILCNSSARSVLWLLQILLRCSNSAKVFREVLHFFITIENVSTYVNFEQSIRFIIWRVFLAIPDSVFVHRFAKIPAWCYSESSPTNTICFKGVSFILLCLIFSENDSPTKELWNCVTLKAAFAHFLMHFDAFKILSSSSSPACPISCSATAFGPSSPWKSVNSIMSSQSFLCQTILIIQSMAFCTLSSSHTSSPAFVVSHGPYSCAVYMPIPSESLFFCFLKHFGGFHSLSYSFTFHPINKHILIMLRLMQILYYASSRIIMDRHKLP